MPAPHLQARPGPVALQLVRPSRTVTAGHDNHMIVPSARATLGRVAEGTLHHPERALGILVAGHGHHRSRRRGRRSGRSGNRPVSSGDRPGRLIRSRDSAARLVRSRESPEEEP